MKTVALIVEGFCAIAAVICIVAGIGFAISGSVMGGLGTAIIGLLILICILLSHIANRLDHL